MGGNGGDVSPAKFVGSPLEPASQGSFGWKEEERGKEGIVKNRDQSSSFSPVNSVKGLFVWKDEGVEKGSCIVFSQDWPCLSFVLENRG